MISYVYFIDTGNRHYIVYKEKITINAEALVIGDVAGRFAFRKNELGQEAMLSVL